MAEERVERRLAAILAADVAGYSRLIGADEEGTLAALRAVRRELIDPGIAEHKGRIVKTTGDGLLAEFASVVDAVRCAAAVQRAMAERNAAIPAERRIEFRIGIHQGDIVVEDGDIFGDGVNVAARLEALAEPGGICVSARVQEDAAGRLDLAFEDLGEQQLKNIARAVRVYRVGPWASGPQAPTLPSPASRGGLARGAGETPAAQLALALPDKPSIAVLPFQNMSGDPEQEYFTDGMVEDIITALSRIRWLFVIARNSSFTYKGQSVDVKEVGRELGVRYVLEGSVRKAGNRVRITGQLIDALSGAHLWADRYDRDLTDIFAVQDEITASVAAIIEPALAEGEQQRVLRKPPESLDAWEAYQRGLWHLYKYGKDENKIAQTFFRRAIEIDPDFAPGHYGFALAQFFDFWLYSARPLNEIVGQGLEEARIAVSLDDKDALAHAVMSFMWVISGEWESAIAEARTALLLNPNSAWSMGTMGTALGFGGYPKEAVEYLRRTMRASPHDPLTWGWMFWMGTTQYYSRDFAAALETMREVTRLRPEHHAALFYGAYCLAWLGRTDEARQAIDRAQAQSPEYLVRFGGRGPWTRPEDFAVVEEGRRLALAAPS
jgi:adenylate cyclase